MKIKSEHIQVYPTAFRDKVGTMNYNPESRLNTEFNLTNRFRLLGNDNYAAVGSKSGSFVVSWNSTSKVLIFLIHGYYFKATLSASDYSDLFSDPSNGDTIWGQIQVLPFTNDEGSNTKYKAFTLVSTDASGSTTTGAPLDNISGDVAKFGGVAITRGTQPMASSTKYTLALLEYNSTSSKWEIPEKSKLILPSSAVKNTDGNPIHRKFTTDELNVAGVTLKAGQYPEYPLEISGGTLVGGDFDVIGDLTINGSGEVSRDLQVRGGLEAQVATIGDNLTVDGDGYVRGGLQVGHDLDVDGGLDVAGNSTIHGKEDVLGDLYVQEDLDVDGNFNVSGDSTINGNEDVSGELHVVSHLKVDGEARIEEGASVGGDEIVDGNLYVKKYIESANSVEGKTVYAATKTGLRFNTGGCYNTASGRQTRFPGALPLPVYTLDDGYRLDRDDSGGSVSPSHAPTTPILLSKFMTDFNLQATEDDEVFILNYICRHISINANSYGGYSESSYTVTNTYWFMIEKGGLSVRLKCLSSRRSSESSSSVSTPVNTTCYKLYWGSTSSTPTIKDQKMQDILNPEEWSTVAGVYVYDKIKAVVISDKLMDIATKNIEIEQINDHGYGVSFGNYTKVDDTKDSVTHIRTYCVGNYHGADFGFGWYYGSGSTTYYNYVDHTGKDYSRQSTSLPSDCNWKLADIYVVHKKVDSTKQFHIYGIAWYEVHMKDYNGNDVYILNPVGIDVGVSYTPPGSGSYHSGFIISGAGAASNIPVKISEQLNDMYIPVGSIQRDSSLSDLSVAVGSSITIPDSDIQVYPDDASDKSFKLISLTPELASVSYDWNTSVTRREWKVRGVAAGTAQIKLMSNDNTDATSTINVTVTAS